MVDPTQTNNSLANNSRCARDIDMSKYILKSEVVPPVCPKCPDSKACPSKTVPHVLHVPDALNRHLSVKSPQLQCY